VEERSGKKITNLDNNEEIVECVHICGERCVCPIYRNEIDGYKFKCEYGHCSEEIVGDSKEEVISKAENHLVKHSSYY